MKNFKFAIRKQGKSDPVIIFQLFDSRFKGRRFMYSTGQYCRIEHWDKRKQQSKLPHINKLLKFIRDTAEEFINSKIHSSTLSRSDLKEFIISKMTDDDALAQLKKQEQEEIWTIWNEIINTTKTRDGRPIGPLTKKQKKQTMNFVKSYATEKHIQLTFQTLDINFYHSFDKWLQVRGLNDNSRGNYLKHIKAILREADDRDVPVCKDYQKKSWKIVRKSPENVFLTTIEIRKIFELNEEKLSKEDIVHKDIFVMACFVGARHSDWHKIRPENVIVENNKEILRYKQTKIGDIIHVPVHSAVKAIWSKYPNIPAVISNQKFNEALKRIAQSAELGKCVINGSIVDKWTEISTHTARRSFATNAYLSKELEVYQIMRCTGHKTESSFLKYLKLDGRDYAALAAESKFFTQDWLKLKIA